MSEETWHVDGGAQGLELRVERLLPASPEEVFDAYTVPGEAEDLVHDPGRAAGDRGDHHRPARRRAAGGGLGPNPSIGSVGDSFDNALAEAVNNLYKTELVRGLDQGP